MALTLKNINPGGFGGYETTDQLVQNTVWWLNWGLLHGYAFNTCQRGDVGYGAESGAAVLTPVTDERFEPGCVWEGLGREWVWESGVNVSGVAPFQVSGVYVGGAFHPRGESGLYSHHIDYRHGRIIFDLPQNTGSLVEAEYTWRQVHVATADSTVFRNLMLNAVENFVAGMASGTPLRENQAFLPAVFIEDRRSTGRGLQLGGGQIRTHDLLFYVFADNPRDRNILLNWLEYQCRTTMILADLNQSPSVFDGWGDIAEGALTWPQMVAAYPWLKARFAWGTTTKLDSLNPSLFRGRVDIGVELDLGRI